MTGTLPHLPWTRDDARAARAGAELRHGLAHRVFSPIMGRVTPLMLRAAAKICGPQVYRPRLQQIADKMNAHRDGFDDYVPRKGDVIVSAYFKAGTNWIMHTCHQICHLGEAEFDHIQDVIPWPDAGQPRYWLHMNDPSPYDSPTGLRVIKSHQPATRVPVHVDAKYIAVTRDPKDCAASAYFFFRSLFFGPTMAPPDVWLDHFMSDDPNFGRWDDFTASWYALHHQPNVLFLTFEDVKQDAGIAIDQIAAFLGVELSPKARAKVIDATSFETMKKINHKFYPPRQGTLSDPRGKMIRQGKVGGDQGLFSPDALARFDQNMTDGLAKLGSDFPYAECYRRKP